ncbi:unnamed protein product [Blepharisma stoltei]|uniref:Uncharacterized protein n=1 Tax=Blepharisma stoltei TaxID=1481888 RepID=A0AAU9K3R8_9CILI|nr:unnamed protein product [Blepharisma stoltei]
MDAALSESGLFPQYLVTADRNPEKEKVPYRDSEIPKTQRKSVINRILSNKEKRMPISVDKVGNILRAGRVVRLNSPTKGYELTKSVNDVNSEEKRSKSPRENSVLMPEEVKIDTITNFLQKTSELRKKSRVPEVDLMKKQESIEEEKEEIIKAINIPPPKLDHLRRSVSVACISKIKQRSHSKTTSSGLESAVSFSKTEKLDLNQFKKENEKIRRSSTGNFMKPTFSSTLAYAKLKERLLPQIGRTLSKEELIGKLSQTMPKKKGYSRMKSIELLRTLKMVRVYKGENDKIFEENSNLKD